MRDIPALLHISCLQASAIPPEHALHYSDYSMNKYPFFCYLHFEMPSINLSVGSAKYWPVIEPFSAARLCIHTTPPTNSSSRTYTYTEKKTPNILHFITKLCRAAPFKRITHFKLHLNSCSFINLVHKGPELVFLSLNSSSICTQPYLSK